MTENSRGCAKRNLKAHIFLFKRRERKSRWLCIFYAVSTVSNSCRRVRNPLKPQFYYRSENERLHDKFVLYDYKGKAEADEDDDAEIQMKA